MRELVYTVYVDTRDRIFKAARRLFDEKGLEGVSLRNVAKKIGITPMAIYRHFEDKEALIDALVLDGLAEWSARVEALPPCNGLAESAQIGDAYLDFALNEPRRYEAAFLLHSSKARRYPDDFLAGRSPAGNAQLEAFREMAAQGLIDKDVAGRNPGHQRGAEPGPHLALSRRTHRRRRRRIPRALPARHAALHADPF